VCAVFRRRCFLGSFLIGSKSISFDYLCVCLLQNRLRSSLDQTKNAFSCVPEVAVAVILEQVYAASIK
jgi:hypothetical protein